MSYTKLFSSIVTSTIWTEDAGICKVWVTMLAIANKHGEVQASIPGLARVAGMTLEETETALAKFLSPDKYSRTPDDEGRRIEPIDGGWLLLNHAKYRAMASKDEEITANAKRQAAFRARSKRNGKVTPSNGQVTPSNDAVTVNRDIAEAKAKADTEAKSENEIYTTSPEPKRRKHAQPITAEWLAEIQKAFPHTSPHSEFAKAKLWCDAKNRTCSRVFLLNWLGRISPPPEQTPIIVKDWDQIQPAE